MWAVQWVTCDSVLHSHFVLQYAHSKQQLLRNKSCISIHNHQTNWHSSLNCTDVFFKSMEKEFPQWYLHHVEGILFARWMSCMHQWTQKLSAAASLLAVSPALDRFWAGCCSVCCTQILHTGIGKLRILKVLARHVQHRQSRKHKDIVIDIKAAYNECQEKYKSWGTGVKGVQVWSWPFTPSSAEVKDKGSYTTSPSLYVHNMGRVGFTHLDKMWQPLAH